MDKEKDTYKYVVKRGGKVISRGRTYDLNRRACEMKARFPDATTKQVGKKVTWQEAEKWIGGKEVSMKLVIPSECQIGAHTFKIVWSPKILDIQEAKGGSEYRQDLVIRLMPNRPITQTLQTLIHEAIHLADFVFDVSNVREEETRILAGALTQFLFSLGIEPDFSQIQEESFVIGVKDKDNG